MKFFCETCTKYRRYHFERGCQRCVVCGQEVYEDKDIILFKTPPARKGDVIREG
jgi:hypothetical protein